MTLEGEVNGIPCKVIPDTGATITIVPREYVPTCQLLDEFEYIQGVAGAPVRAQCARVNFKLGKDQFRLRVVVASDKLNTDSVLFAIPLDKESAKKLLLGAASRAGHSGDTPDAQGGDKTMVDSPSLPECASHAFSEEQRCLAITRNQTREIEANRVRDGEQAKREAGLLTGIPTITSEEARLILDSLGRLDNNKPAETSSQLEDSVVGTGFTEGKQTSQDDNTNNNNASVANGVEPVVDGTKALQSGCALDPDAHSETKPTPPGAGVASKTTHPGGVATPTSLSGDLTGLGKETASVGSSK